MRVVVEVTSRDGSTQTIALVASTEVQIGRIPGNDVVLPVRDVSKRHARLVIKDDKLILVDLKSTNGTSVNGRRISSPLVIRERDSISIGGYQLRCWLDELDAETLEVDATELQLLASIAQQEPGSRMVYADWLEQQGDPSRAEFLRLQELIPTLVDGSHFQATSDRMRELAREIKLEWRKKVARPLIENCLGFELECPKEWGALAATERADLRYCGACRRLVHYCSTVEEARTHAQRGACVAVDVVAIRRRGDLAPPPRPMVMGRMVAYDPDE